MGATLLQQRRAQAHDVDARDLCERALHARMPEATSPVHVTNADVSAAVGGASADGAPMRSKLAAEAVRYRVTMSRPSEDWQEILERFERGDSLAVAKVSDVIIGYLHHFRAYDRRSSWDDLCQEALIALLRTVRRGGLRDPQAFVAYTGKVVRNRLANYAQRTDRKDRNVELDDEHLNCDTAVVDQRPEAERSEVALDIEHGLAGLPERCRKVIEHIYLHGYSYQETATRLSLSLSAVKRDQIKGLKVLRETLGIEQ